VPDGATVIFSAHGVSRRCGGRGRQRGLRVFDATCPLVTKVHLEVARHCRPGATWC
jgi:4-hydroxy-3-methylbut-2-en-1-yl diphosphate reductase